MIAYCHHTLIESLLKIISSTSALLFCVHHLLIGHKALVGHVIGGAMAVQTQTSLIASSSCQASPSSIFKLEGDASCLVAHCWVTGIIFTSFITSSLQIFRIFISVSFASSSVSLLSSFPATCPLKLPYSLYR